MAVYLVGGAVRDQLLGYPVKEHDWVVVGETPESLLDQGFEQVGRDFPVFLHPKTREEYALARTERKRGKGYYGFVCDFNPKVRLEDDLARRDLTINAMAMDEAGKIIDPYHGQRDLNDKLLRHVSPAFVEDPVRVLRVARFLARYHHLGFTLADETWGLMYQMVKNGELAHLVPERVWQECQRSLEERNPEYFIKTLRSCGALKAVFPELDALFGVPSIQNSLPIDSGLSALFVLGQVVLVSTDPSLRWAALLHNLGHAFAPVSQWPLQAVSPEYGISALRTLSERLRVPKAYRALTERVIRFWHATLYSDFQDAEAIVFLLEQCDIFRRRNFFEALLLICEAMGCDKARIRKWKSIEAVCVRITADKVISDGFQGSAIQAELHQRRVAAVMAFNNGKGK